MLEGPEDGLTPILHGYLRTFYTSTDSRPTLRWGCLPVIFPSGVPRGQCLACGKSAVRRPSAQDGKREPFKETALDCLTYFRSLDETLDWSDYLSADKEKQILDAWILIVNISVS